MLTLLLTYFAKVAIFRETPCHSHDSLFCMCKGLKYHMWVRVLTQVRIQILLKKHLETCLFLLRRHLLLNPNLENYPCADQQL